MKPETMTVSPSDQSGNKASLAGSAGQNPLLQAYLDQSLASKRPYAQPDVSSVSTQSAPPVETDRKTSTKPQKPADQWLVIADLGILFDDKGTHGQMGAAEKLANLEALTNETKGKPVTIIADVLVNDGSDLSKGQLLSESKKPYLVERVVIHDGELKIISTDPSQGTQKDLSDLIDYSLKNAPGEKVALAINAHGLGNQGIEGGMLHRDNGLVSVETVASTIQSALKENGRNKLDLVDFDSCLMAQNGVLQQLAPVTKDIVASEDTEKESTGTTELDGQNLGKWIGDLLQNPSMDGVHLGKQIVAEANQNANSQKSFQDGETIEGTKTLTNFDLAQLPEFNDKLNTLGVQLTRAMADPSSRRIIGEQIHLQNNITDAGQKDVPPHGAYAAKRDLLGLVDRLSKWVSNGGDGGIPDPDHKLKAALIDMQSYLQDRTKLIDSAHLPVQQYSHTAVAPLHEFGGVSVYVPSDQRVPSTPEQIKERQRVIDIESGGNAGWNAFLKTL